MNLWLESAPLLHCLLYGACPRIHQHVLLEISLPEHRYTGFIEAPLEQLREKLRSYKRINIAELGNCLWWVPQEQLNADVKSTIYEAWQKRHLN